MCDRVSLGAWQTETLRMKYCVTFYDVDGIIIGKAWVGAFDFTVAMRKAYQDVPHPDDAVRCEIEKVDDDV
jgi:hypothetical protein